MLPKEFSAKVNSIIAQNNLLFSQGSKEAVAYITELQKEVRSAIVGAKGFDLAHLKSIQSDLDTAGKQLQKKLTMSIQTNQEGAFNLGSSIVLQGFKVAGINLTLPKLPATLLATVKDFSADLITNLTADAIEEISGIIRRGIITGQNPYETMESIDNNVFPDEEGLFGRAETIVRTENNRIFGLANQERLDQAYELLPGLKKIWVTTIDDRTRPSHAQAGEDYAPGGAIGPIPVEEPFMIAGEAVAFPGDPEGDPHEVINCRCVSVPFIDNWEKETADLADTLQEGGPGSGNFGHSGRHGEVGGSSGDANTTVNVYETNPSIMHTLITKEYNINTGLDVRETLPVRLPDGRIIHPTAYYHPNKDEIKITKEGTSRAPGKGILGSVYGTADVFGGRGIVCHELGHSVAGKTGADTTHEFRVIDANMRTKNMYPFPSTYARESHKENFAENFSVYKLNPGWLQKNNPPMYAYMKKIK